MQARMGQARFCQPATWPRACPCHSLARILRCHAKQHPFLHHAQVQTWRSSSGQRPDGRIAGIQALALQHDGSLTRERPVKPDAPSSPFHDLGLEDLWDYMGHVRVRQHVNPLRKEFQIPHAPLPWDQVFADPTKPLLVDVGCGSGRFLLKRQKTLGQEQNALGIEIRRALVRRANKWAELLQLNGRLHYVFANATVSLSSLLATYPGPITHFTIQMPDPQFKMRHKKRRVVQPQLIKDAAQLLAPHGFVFLQSDVEEVAVDMRNMFEQYAGGVFMPAEEHEKGPVFFSNEEFKPQGPTQPKQSTALTRTAYTDMGACSKDSEAITTHTRRNGNGTAKNSIGTGAAGTCTGATSAGAEAPGTDMEALTTHSGAGSTGMGVVTFHTGATSAGAVTTAAGTASEASSMHTEASSTGTGPASNTGHRDMMAAASNNSGSASSISNAGSISHSNCIDTLLQGVQREKITQSSRENIDQSSWENITRSSRENFDHSSTSGRDSSANATYRELPNGIEAAYPMAEPLAEASESMAESVESLPESAEVESQWRRWGWLEVNPMGIPTEREHFAVSRGGRVYRVLLRKHVQ